MTSTPPAVPKPANPGQGRTAIVNTRLAYANIRNGPSTRHLDIGDIFDKTVVTHFPQTRTADGWVWIEQGQLVGWISTSVVTFEDTVTTPPPPAEPTPYDGRVAVWHWKGDVLSETSIEAVAANIKRAAPHVNALFVKTSDYTPRSGPRWQGFWDTKRALAIDGPESIDRWVQVLDRHGIEFHAWCVPRGLDIPGETELIIQACSRPGVRSMILDIEPYAGFWSAGRAGVRPFMTAIRRSVPGSFHIGMAVDPRSQHFATIFPDEWFPFINSIHPMVYWATFRRTPDDSLAETYRVWGNYGRPIIPILQGDAAAVDMRTAVNLSVQRHAARGLSWWRLGVIGPVEWTAVNQPIQPGTPPTDPSQPPQYGEEIVVKPGDAGFAFGSYTGRNELSSYVGTWGWPVYFKEVELQRSKIWVQWQPQLSRSGKYEVSAFIPQRRGTTQNARYNIHGVVGSDNGIVQVSIDQSRHRNEWVTLGVFEFDRNVSNAGTIFANDLTFEFGLAIAFDAMRWRHVIEGGGTIPDPGVRVADGFDSPVGTVIERAGTQVWPAGWRDASGFGANTVRAYVTNFGSYHTGADLNFGVGGNADLGMPVFSPASGVVIYQADLRPWGNLTIIKHDPLRTSNGRVYYSRFGHMQNVIVNVGQRVERGQRIGEIGTGGGRYVAHLHYDISPTTIFERSPGDWPGMDLNRLLRDYVDPLAFTRAHRPSR